MAPPPITEEDRAAGRAAAQALRALGEFVEPEAPEDAAAKQAEKAAAEARETTGHYIRALSLSLAGIMGIAATFVVAVVTSFSDKLAVEAVLAREVEVRVSGELFVWLSVLLLIGVAVAGLLQYCQYLVHRERLTPRQGAIVGSALFAAIVVLGYVNAEVGVCGGRAMALYGVDVTADHPRPNRTAGVFWCEDELNRWGLTNGWSEKKPAAGGAGDQDGG